MLAFGAILEPRWPLEPPRDPRDRFWTDFGMILNRFWIDFGSILNDLGVHFLINSKQCLDTQVQVERLLSGCRIIRSHARLLRSYSKWATQCHCLAYLFACLLTYFLACLLSSLPTCLLACLLANLLAYLPACLLTWLRACSFACLCVCFPCFLDVGFVCCLTQQSQARWRICRRQLYKQKSYKKS